MTGAGSGGGLCREACCAPSKAIPFGAEGFAVAGGAVDLLFVIGTVGAAQALVAFGCSNTHTQ